MATTRERIERWLGEIVATAGSAHEACQVALMHTAVDQSQRHVKTWKLNQSEAELARLTEDMDDTAEGDAEALGGRQRYSLRAQLRGKDMGSLTLRYDIPNDTGCAVDSEPATTAGVVALLQRHAEGSTRMLLQGVGTIVESLRAHIASQNELLSQFQQQAAASFRMQEELASRKTESELLLAERRTQLEITAAKEAAEIERKNLTLQVGLKHAQDYLPLLLNYLTTGKAGTEPETSADLASEQGSAAAQAPGAGQTPAGISSDVVAASAERLYAALCARRDRLGSLVPAFMARTPIVELDDEGTALIHEVAHELAANQIDAQIAAEGLWTALLAFSPPRLLALAEAVRTESPWSQLSTAQRLDLLTAARDTLAHGERPEAARSASVTKTVTSPQLG